MKRLIFVLIALLSITCSYSQTKVTVSSKIPNTKTQVSVQIPVNKTFLLSAADEGTITTNKADYKGTIYPVYATKKGKLFIKLISKSTGKEYRKYIDPDKVEIKQ